MKRLIVTGLPCAPSAWEAFFGSRRDQKILSMFDIFENTDSSDPRQLALYVQSQIEAFQPNSIICHDMGVPLTIMSLLRLRRHGRASEACVTLFNGAFRGVDIFTANEPFRLQFMSGKQAVREVESHGGVVDRRLQKHLGRIRAMYRMVILFGLSEKVSALLGLDHFLGLPGRFALRVPVQMIASKNDPYIPFDAIEQLSIDCSVERFLLTEYGHFPYAGDSKQILKWVTEFENAHSGSKKASSGRRTSRKTSAEISGSI